MAARGGDDMKALLTLDALIFREVATIGAIDSVMPREKHPGYVMLLHDAKFSKQASVEQLVSIIRRAGAHADQSAAPVEAILKMQTAIARRAGTTVVLRAMRLAELEIVRAYGAALGELEGIAQKGLEKCWRRAIKRLTVLTAHIAIRGRKPELEEIASLPMPLGSYFANGEDRVCFRCLFDRPGDRDPIERSDPQPYQYLCAKCHDEVLSDFPPDLMESAGRWSDRERESHVLERAFGRASKLIAESVVLANLSGVAPDMPPPPLPRKQSHDASPKRRAPAQPRPRIELGGVAESALEQAYADALFDYDTVRANW